MTLIHAYLALAASAFSSATFLPGTSEAAFGAFLYRFPEHACGAWLCAGLSNGLGSMVSYALGRLLPDTRRPSEKTVAFFQRWGIWSLLLAWLPVIGDALPLAAGWLRLNAAASALLLIAGKMLRYGAIWLGIAQVF